MLGELVKGVYEIGMGKFGLCEDYASVSGKVNGGINSASTNLKENVQVHMNNMDMGINNGNIGNGSMQI